MSVSWKTGNRDRVRGVCVRIVTFFLLAWPCPPKSALLFLELAPGSYLRIADLQEQGRTRRTTMTIATLNHVVILHRTSFRSSYAKCAPFGIRSLGSFTP